MDSFKQPVDLGALETRIHREIPISRYMQVRVIDAHPQLATLAVPLGPNTNHEGTAFGGSVSSTALLACWALVTVNLDQLAPQQFDYVVVQDSHLNFTRPIDSDFSATARAESELDLETFLKTLKKRGRARLALRAEVHSQTGLCAVLQARFVAQLKATLWPR